MIAENKMLNWRAFSFLLIISAAFTLYLLGEYTIETLREFSAYYFTYIGNLLFASVGSIIVGIGSLRVKSNGKKLIGIGMLLTLISSVFALSYDFLYGFEIGFFTKDGSIPLIGYLMLDCLLLLISFLLFTYFSRDGIKKRIANISVFALLIGCIFYLGTVILYFVEDGTDTDPLYILSNITPLLTAIALIIYLRLAPKLEELEGEQGSHPYYQ